MKIVLASTSQYRKKLLEQLHLVFLQAAPQVDESQLKKTASIPVEDLALFLATEKAGSVVSSYPDDLVIGSDQMVLFEGAGLDKPGTKDNAIAQLKRLQGKTHRLVTALAVHYHGKWSTHVNHTELTMKELAEDQIRRYVDLENPLDCSGSYKVEGLGLALFEKIQTEDATAIVGLPLMALIKILEKHGHPLL